MISISNCKKRIALVLLSVTALCMTTTDYYAHERAEHDRMLASVLVGSRQGTLSYGEMNALKVLQSAAYLSIDQFNWASNESGQKDFEFLVEQNIPGLPSSLEEIDFAASGTTHRTFTHMGWNHVYESDRAHWDRRKKILRNAVKYTFDFNIGNKKEQEQLESMCSLIYYTHVLGDFLDDNYSRSLTNGKKIPLGGESNLIPGEDSSLISAITEDCEVLFGDQWYKPRYIYLKTKLNSLNSKAEKYGDGSMITNESEFNKYHEISEDLRRLLESSIPPLLSNEAFFQRTFSVEE